MTTPSSGLQPSPLAPAATRGLGFVRVLINAWFLLGGMINAGLVGPNRVSIQREFELGPFAFGLGLGVLQLLFPLAVLMASPSLRRLGLARVVLGGLAVQAAGFLLICTAPILPLIAAGWALVIVGLVTGSLFNNISMDLWPDAPRRGVLLIHAFNGIGKTVGPAVSGVALAFGWRLSFAAVGAVTLAVLAAFAACRRQLARLGLPSESSSPRRDLAVLRRPFYWACVIPFGVIAGGEAAFATLVPLFLVQQRGLSPNLASFLLSVHLAGLAVGRFGGAWLGSRLGNNTIIAICLAMGLFAVPAVLTGSMAILVICLFLAGLQFSATWPVYYAQVARFLPDDRDMLAYGSTLATQAGFSIFIMASSALAERSLPLAVLFGPAALGLFGVAYFASRLSGEAVPRAG